MKTPPIDDTKAVDGGYSYNLTTPTAFALYRPTKERLPPNIPAPIPSVCIQLLDGKDEQQKASGRLRIRLVFATWSPGLHGRDIFNPIFDEYENHQQGSYTQWSGEEAQSYYRRDSEGWRDAWNLVDTARRELENAEYISDNLQIAHAEGITFGPVAEQETIIDLYPYWYDWIDFSVEYGLTRNRRDVEIFL
jgi:hypothetical protein